VVPVAVRIPEREKSGEIWVQRFLGSNSISELEPDFSDAVRQFIAALKTAGTRVSVSATYRPPERAYLMHWSWKISKKKVKAEEVPLMQGVNIQWDHGDEKSSVNAASAMVSAFGMDSLEVAPALSSRHTERKAIDMTISWTSEELIIIDASGDEVLIDSGPKTGMNAKLHEVGASYGVVKFWLGASDKPHWSTDGR
jgi:hypothetical protein